MANFEVYIGGSNRGLRTAQTVSITSVGRIGFSRPAYEAMGSPEAVVLLTDRAEQLIGFRPAGVEEPSAYRLNPRSLSVSSTAILQYLEFDYSVSRRWPLLCDDGTWHIDLKQEGVPVTSNRRKKQPAS